MYKLKFSNTIEIHNYRPQNIDYIYVVLNTNIIGKIIKNIPPNSIECLESLSVDIEITGIDNEGKKHFACWHIDRHLIEEGDNPTNTIHPLFHIHFGGNKLQDQIDQTGNFGDLLILDAPRTQFPPLDIPLSIDFILSNFYGKYRRKMINERIYASVIKKSQTNYWKPYYCSIYSFWQRQVSNSIDPLILNPCLIS